MPDSWVKDLTHKSRVSRVTDDGGRVAPDPCVLSKFRAHQMSKGSQDSILQTERQPHLGVAKISAIYRGFGMNHMLLMHGLHCDPLGRVSQDIPDFRNQETCSSSSLPLGYGFPIDLGNLFLPQTLRPP